MVSSPDIEINPRKLSLLGRCTGPCFGSEIFETLSNGKVALIEVCRIRKVYVANASQNCCIFKVHCSCRNVS